MGQRQKVVIDLNGPILLVMGGVFLYHGRRRSSSDDDDLDSDHGVTSRRIAKAAIIVGSLLIIGAILAVAGFIAFFVLVSMGP